MKSNIYIVDYLKKYDKIYFTDNHELSDKKELLFLRNGFDLGSISICIDKVDDIIEVIEKLVMLGYNCLAVDVIKKNYYLLQLSNKSICFECLEHLDKEYYFDMNSQFIYEEFCSFGRLESKRKEIK